MSKRVESGVHQALMKRHYHADDFVQVPLTVGMAEDYYVAGTMAFLSDPTVVNIEFGWTLFTHGQAAPPAFLAAILAALGIAWPATVPSFEGKDILFHPDQDCWIRFEGAARVQHFIPANSWIRFHRPCFILYVIIDPAVAVNGTLNVWIEG